jgi:hypothetical protein
LQDTESSSALHPEAAIFAVYGMIHLILLLATAEVEQVKSLLHVLGLR